MTKMTNQKILELALTSSDPLIKQTVDKLIFALKMKYADEDLIHIHDNYMFHHAAVLHIPNEGDTIELSVAWKHENFSAISIEHQYYMGQAADMVCGEDIAHHYLLEDCNYGAAG